MAIVRKNQNTGNKTVTTGTTFTIALASAAGEAIFVGVTTTSTTSTVTGITDGGGNTYDLIKAINGTGVRTELWKARGTLASGTITVSVVTGFRAVGVAASYTGIAYPDHASTTAVGSTSPVTSGAVTVPESADFLIMMAGVAANNALTAQNGLIVGQLGTTAIRGGMIENTGATSVTDSATLTAAQWAVVWTTLRAIAVSADTMTQSDALAQNAGGIGFLFADALELRDMDSTGVLTGIETLDSNGFATWRDCFRILIDGQYKLPLSDGVQFAKVLGVGARTPGQTQTVSVQSEVWKDGTPQIIQQLTLAIGCPHLGQNWLDAVVMAFGSGPAMQLTLVDQDTTWADALGIGYGLQISETLNLWLDVVGALFGFSLLVVESLNNWLDLMQAGYGMATSDQMIIVDSLGAGYGAQLSDNLNNWLDLVGLNLAGTILQVQVQDSINNWSDALGAGYGNAVNDGMAWQDQLGVGYGLWITDDESGNWLDFVPGFTFDYQLAVGESINSWLDLMMAGYGMATSDQMIIVDSIGAGYGAVLSDNLNNWLDLLGVQLAGGAAIQLQLSDQDTTWADSLGIGYGLKTSDQLQQSDALGAGYGSGVSDSTNSWSDALGAGYGNFLTDQDVSWLDAMKVEFGFVINPTEQLQMLDQLRLGYGLWITDNLNGWLDLFGTNIVSSLITVVVSDSLNSWLELLGAGYGNLVTDQMAVADALGAGYGLWISDDSNKWLDATSKTLNFLVLIGESINNWLDLLGLLLEAGSVYQLSLSDQLSWVDALGIGYGLVIGEQITWLDELLIAGKFFGPASVVGVQVMMGISIHQIQVRQLVSVMDIQEKLTTTVAKVGVL